MNNYTIGSQVQLSATFSVGGTNTNPTSVTCAVKDPSGAVTSLTTANPSPGVYTAFFTPSMSGTHYYHFVGTGTVVVAAESSFYVQYSSF